MNFLGCYFNLGFIHGSALNLNEIEHRALVYERQFRDKYSATPGGEIIIVSNRWEFRFILLILLALGVVVEPFHLQVIYVSEFTNSTSLSGVHLLGDIPTSTGPSTT